jgi:hypothetical protein
MDEKEREVNAQQYKDRVDLNEQQANEWGKFLKLKKDYSQKYGEAYANILLRKEREALEAKFDKDHQNLSKQHDQQWLSHHEDDSAGKPYNLPQFLKEPEPGKAQSGKDAGKDMTEGAAAILDQYRQHTMRNVQTVGKEDEPQASQQINSQTREILYPNPFNQGNKEQENIPPGQADNFERSQDSMIAMRSVNKESIKEENKVTVENKPSSMSALFSQSLSYSRTTEKTEKSPERAKDIDRD